MEDNTKEYKEINEKELNHHELVQFLQKNTSNIRNICVLAHVDHGKTTLVDSLISYNNIISPKMAGNVRYMDSREDEQERCITMKASSISVIYRSEKLNSNYLLNIIDVPGHIDFSYEIFSSLKMVDGALILIDVVEGICSQTESVIRQAWDEKIKCVLVFNKIDKLFNIIELSAEEAYEHLKNLLEKVNAMMSSLILRDIEINNILNLEKKDSNISTNEKENDIKKENDIIEEKEKETYFSPNKGNVIFASATDNWAFTIDKFADIFAKKHGTKKEIMQKVLWGDYYLDKKTKKFCSKPPTEDSNPVFVDFIMKNIYKVYQVVTVDQDLAKIQKMVKSLNLNISEKDLNQNILTRNPNLVLRAVMREWLPIPQTIYDIIIKELPNPILGVQNKIELLFPHIKYSHNEFVKDIKKKIKNNIIKGENIPTIAYISKMVAIPKKNIQGLKFEEINNNKDETKFMAFARLYTGEIKEGDEYYVIGPKHDPKNNKYDIKKYNFSNIYYFMGQFLNQIKNVPVGNIFSVSDLEKDVFKTSTISNNFNCPSIIPLNLNQNSNIKVSITAENIKEMPILLEGLEKLNRSDPAVNYYTQSNGEHILITSGEVHLERCIKDLEDELAKIKFKISPPIVNFKEGLSNFNYTFKKKTLNKKKNY
jgi:ribosome assembly protein 1